MEDEAVVNSFYFLTGTIPNTHNSQLADKAVKIEMFGGSPEHHAETFVFRANRDIVRVFQFHLKGDTY